MMHYPVSIPSPCKAYFCNYDHFRIVTTKARAGVLQHILTHPHSHRPCRLYSNRAQVLSCIASDSDPLRRVLAEMRISLLTVHVFCAPEQDLLINRLVAHIVLFKSQIEEYAAQLKVQEAEKQRSSLIKWKTSLIEINKRDDILKDIKSVLEEV